MKSESTCGISGLISLFKECTQLFDLIDSSPPDETDFKLMSKADFDLVSTILEIEQVRLCIWGQAVGLATDDQVGYSEPWSRSRCPQLYWYGVGGWGLLYHN
jgi:hypothetical protein